MAATTRTITDTIYKMDGTPWAGATVRINRVDRPMVDTDGTIGDSVATGTTDANGDVSLTVAVPPSGAGRYLLTRPVETGRPVDVTYFYLAAGDPISVGEILAASASALTEDAVLTLLSAYLSKANNLSDLASAATARTNLGLGTAATAAAGDFEAALGNPDADGYVLSSTAAGVRSWVEGGGGASDVDDLATSTGSSTNMLRVAAAGGLEYRTAAQVLSDIGAAPTASPTFTGTVTAPTIVGGVIKPASNSTTALKLTKADGVTSVLTVDTTNSQLILNPTSVDAKGLIIGASAMPSGVSLYIENGTPDFRQKIVRASGGLASNFMNVWVKNSTTSLETEAFAFGTLANVQNGATPPSISYIYMSSLASPAYNNANFFMLPSGYIGIGTGNNAPTARLDIAASTTAAASLRIRSGTAPTTPNAGDVWFDGTNLKFYDGTATKTISWT